MPSNQLGSSGEGPMFEVKREGKGDFTASPRSCPDLHRFSTDLADDVPDRLELDGPVRPRPSRN